MTTSSKTPAQTNQRSFTTWRWQFAICLVVALALRVQTFGDPNIHVDEAWYFLVGQEMHKGALVYVDIWDRKPLGLFLIYYLIAGISHAVIAYQLVAWLFASTTAFVIVRMASLWTGPVGSTLAGLAYLAALLPLIGVGGQAPVFYNLPMASAAWCILTALPSLKEGKVARRVYAAMALCGLAISCKQTALFESAFFGLFVVWTLYKAKASVIRFVIGACLLGAAPMLAFGLFYLAHGHFTEFWMAMVTSNLSKGHSAALAVIFRIVGIVIGMALLLPAALLGILLKTEEQAMFRYRPFIRGWLLAATIGFLSVPNAYGHYALPLLVPLSVAAAALFNRRYIGWAVFALTFCYCTYYGMEWDRQRHLTAERNMASLADTIRHHDRGGLLIFDGPPALYFLSGARPMTPLAFPHHLNHEFEKNVSQFNTLSEVKRVIALRPGAMVMELTARNFPPNFETRRIVRDYITRNCTLLDWLDVPEFKRDDQVIVYGDCNHRPST